MYSLLCILVNNKEILYMYVKAGTAAAIETTSDSVNTYHHKSGYSCKRLCCCVFVWSLGQCQFCH